MRRFTLSVLVLGCLALAIATFMGPNADPISVSLSAQAETCTAGCSIEPGQTDKEGHRAYCHVDHGGAGHIICPSLSSIEQHFANHNQDFCINTSEQLAECAAKK